MSYKKSLNLVKPNVRMNSKLARMNNQKSPVAGQGLASNYASPLPEIYEGHTQRIPRYGQYDQMDEDSDINGSLDTITDFCTQSDDNTGRLFDFKFHREPSNVEVKILNQVLRKWTEINEFDVRLWRMFRNTLKYGDQFFIRDPETQKWIWVDPANVEKVLVNEQEGKKILSYIISDLDLNAETLTATSPTQYSSNLVGGGNNTLQNNTDPSAMGGYGIPNHYNNGTQHMTVVDAEHVIHLSLSEGLDGSWPFGTSFLESVYKVYRQKTLLEDAMLIYRIHRAPERRVFYIDTGSLPVHKANAYINRIKTEVRQRRVPSRNGDGQNVASSSYNPLCISVFTQIPLLDGTYKSLVRLINDYKNGVENWTYSIDIETGKIVPGLISWAGVTKIDSDVFDLHLSNGNVLTCTPDHKIPVIGKGYVEAQHITEDDVLYSYEIQKEEECVSIYDYETKGFVDTKEMTGKFFKSLGKHQELTYFDTDSEKDIIVNRDGNLSNVDPRNIYFMSKNDSEEFYHDMHGKNISKIVPTQKEISEVRVVKRSDMYKVNVGTLTIDQYEKFHKHHNFATCAGIFVKNSMIEDYFFAVGESGRSSKVTTLQGGDALSSIDDMRYFSNILKRGMRVPSSYMPSGPEDGQTTFNDGRVGTAYIQEYRFAEFCKRLQRMIAPVFNKEFKHYLAESGFEIDSDLFNITFNPPQHFSEYARVERDVAMINTFTPLVQLGFFSKRFLMERYLGMTKEEIVKNEILLVEENPDLIDDQTADNAGLSDEAGTAVLPNLDDIGVHPDEQVPGGGDDGQSVDDQNADGTPEAPATTDGEQSNEF